ncbi:hypothetical protein BKA70DRAFT_1290090 [Coprinopsis sp. MPI-PUGE-AT-0042]|nr:hypothetical protein BKA70DRAFT_1290090 [Coprinopsis sp. MPI-PUGE-AT-0042]
MEVNTSQEHPKSESTETERVADGDLERLEDGRVIIEGAILHLPKPNDLFFKRVIRTHIEPLPPLHRQRGPNPIPLLALCLPFTYEDQLRFIELHKIGAGNSKTRLGTRIYAGLQFLRQNLPKPYTRWTTIDESTRCVVLATNASKADLSLAFNLDKLEAVRRFMGVPWIPTWNEPEAELQTPIWRTPRTTPADLVNWPEDLPCQRSLTWESAQHVDEDDWGIIWERVETRAAVHARVKGGQVPDFDTPMSEAFKLDEPIYNFTINREFEKTGILEGYLGF